MSSNSDSAYRLPIAKELFSESSLAFALKLLSMGLGYATTLFITNKYGASGFGLFTLSITLISMFSLLPHFGMSTALVRVVGELYAHNQVENMKRVLFSALLFISTASLVFSFFLQKASWFISTNFFDNSELTYSLITISPAIVSTGIILFVSSAFQGLKKTGYYVFFNLILHQILFLLLLWLNSWCNFNLSINTCFLYSNALSSILGLLCLTTLLLRFPTHEMKRPTNYTLLALLKIAAPMLLANSFVVIMSWVDVLMLGFFMTDADVGTYSAAIKLASLISLSLVAINAVVTPRFVELYVAGDSDGLKALSRFSAKIACAISIPIYFSYVIFSEELMSIFGSEFSAGAGVLLVLSSAQLCNVICGPVGNLMQMTDHEVQFRNVVIGSVVINLGLNYWLIPHYGMLGAGYATFASLTSLNIILVLFVRSKMGFWVVPIPAKYGALKLK